MIWLSNTITHKRDLHKRRAETYLYPLCRPKDEALEKSLGRIQKSAAPKQGTNIFPQHNFLYCFRKCHPVQFSTTISGPNCPSVFALLRCAAQLFVIVILFLLVLEKKKQKKAKAEPLRPNTGVPVGLFEGLSAPR